MERIFAKMTVEKEFLVCINKFSKFSAFNFLFLNDKLLLCINDAINCKLLKIDYYFTNLND